MKVSLLLYKSHEHQRIFLAFFHVALALLLSSLLDCLGGGREEERLFC